MSLGRKMTTVESGSNNTMRFQLRRTSCWATDKVVFPRGFEVDQSLVQYSDGTVMGDNRFIYHVEIDSLDKLLLLMKKSGHSLVIIEEEPYPIIEIYDDYRE